jgi:hypothetical protein
MLKRIAIATFCSLMFVSNAHAIRGVVCDDGNVLPAQDFADDACADQCLKPRCGGVLMYCYTECMDRQDDAQSINPRGWRQAFGVALDYFLTSNALHGSLEGIARLRAARIMAKEIAEETVYAKQNEQQEAYACTTGAPSRNGLALGYASGIFSQGNPYPNTPGVWIYHTNPKLPGACWYPGPESFVLTGNTLTTLPLRHQGVIHTPVPPFINLPHVNHPATNRPDGQPSIDPCTTTPSLCNPNPHPLPPDPSIDPCFWDGTCTDFDGA